MIFLNRKNSLGKELISHQIRSDQSLSRVQLFATTWITARQASLSITNSRSSLRLSSTESVMPSSHLILCRPLLLLPPIPPSIRVFSNESTLCIRWPKYWSFSFSIIPSKEISGLISFRMDWLDLLAVQGTLKSLLQHHSSKASILRCSAFFTVQLSHPHMTTGRTIALTRWTFVGSDHGGCRFQVHIDPSIAGEEGSLCFQEPQTRTGVGPAGVTSPGPEPRREAHCDGRLRATCWETESKQSLKRRAPEIYHQEN